MIRAADENDLPCLIQLEFELFPNPMSEMMLKRELEIGRGLVVAEPGGSVTAYALLRRDGMLTDLTRLGVSRECQGKGHGTALLKQVIGESGDLMLTVQKSNAVALKLYQRLGFEVVAHLAAATAWVMVRKTGPLPP